MEGDLEGGQTGSFWAFARAGKKLADMHLNYETYQRYEGLQWVTKAGKALDYRVEKMRPQGKRKSPLPKPLSNALERGLTASDGEGESSTESGVVTDVTGHVPTDGNGNGAEITVFDALQYNSTLTITGIPEKAFAYRLGNRSALEWVIDQYQVRTDRRSGITSDPNGYSDDDQYIIKLVERVIQVSVDTVEIVEELAKLAFREG